MVILFVDNSKDKHHTIERQILNRESEQNNNLSYQLAKMLMTFQNKHDLPGEQLQKPKSLLISLTIKIILHLPIDNSSQFKIAFPMTNRNVDIQASWTTTKTKFSTLIGQHNDEQHCR